MLRHHLGRLEHDLWALTERCRQAARPNSADPAAGSELSAAGYLPDQCDQQRAGLGWTNAWSTSTDDPSFQIANRKRQLPTPQQFEQALLSHNPQSMAQVSQTYAKVYGTVMAPADAPQPIRDLVDMTDAEAQAALKKALQLDALADVELTAADQINQQIQNAAPGSASILEAQAAAWLVRANAYTQSAMAELIRVRSIDLANSGAQMKLSANDTNQLRNNTNQILGRGAQ
jgi:hypothetical protein